MAKTHATMRQSLAIGKLLEQHLRQEGEVWTYNEGWSDAHIAELVSTPENRLNDKHVAFVRNQAFGRLIKAGRDDATIGRLAVAEAELAEIKKKFNALAELHAKLCESLAVNHVVDVRHLSGRRDGIAAPGINPNGKTAPATRSPA